MAMGTRFRRGVPPFVLSAAMLFMVRLATAADLTVVTGGGDSKLEQVAAQAIVEQLRRICPTAAVELAEQPPAADGPLIVSGALAEGTLAAEVLGESAPPLTSQEILLRSLKWKGRDVLAVVGGSPTASLWAAHELGHRLGVRHLLTGDVYPEAVQELDLRGWDVQMAPKVGSRGWVVLDASPAGMWSWGLQDRRKLIGQLAKLKFNHVVFQIEPWQPLYRLEHAGLAKAARKWWTIDPLPVDGDTAGRAAFRGAREFENPDLAGKTGDELTKAGMALVNDAIEAAHELGMTASIAIVPFHLPAEFASKTPDVQLLGAHVASVDPRVAFGQRQGPAAANKAIQAVVKAQIQAVTAAYPQADRIDLASGAFPSGVRFVDGLWRAAATEPGPSLTAGSPGAAALLLSDSQLGLLPQFPDIVAFFAFSGEKPPSSVIVRGGHVGDSDALAWRVSRASWEGADRATLADLFESIAGEGPSERMAKAFTFLEKGGELMIDQGGAASGDLSEAVWRHYATAKPAPAAWKEAANHYVEAMNEMYRAHDRATRGRPWLRYFTKRLEFAFEYLTCLEACRAAGEAQAQGDADLQIEKLEVAVESMYNGLQALSEVARDPSDRGTIAMLNVYGYRRLKAELDRLAEGQ